MAHGDITHVEIPVDDTDRATAFYNGLFGWGIQEFPGFEGYPMWRAPNQVSGGGLVQRSDAQTAPRAYVEVDSIDDVLRRVTEHGGRVTAPKTEISPTSWSAAFVDPDGNEIGIYEGMTESGDSPVT
ncbi:VOC family protein [Cellulomonas endometrii]|jgi:predicted enzyme related to lactoylglutathione lyase|uniref:VOC family protein n=1 Tax=Cellulomonas endometrii TaxID=3036301 RepID=UPI0024AD23B6|nr:VOC family protein [Cellulomonas endometrii]